MVWICLITLKSQKIPFLSQIMSYMWYFYGTNFDIP